MLILTATAVCMTGLSTLLFSLLLEQNKKIRHQDAIIRRLELIEQRFIQDRHVKTMPSVIAETLKHQKGVK